MTFFGGFFLMTITVLETLRLVCWEDVKENVKILKENYIIAKRENEKDNALDEDGNGIADVLEIDNQTELILRKIKVLMKSINREQVEKSLRLLSSAILSVIATLKVKSARTLTLSASIANLCHQYIPLDEILINLGKNQTKFSFAEYEKFVPLAEKFIFHVFSFFLASMLSNIITTLHCCAAGAFLLVSYALHIAKEKHLLEDGLTIKSEKTKILILIVTAVGFLFQMSSMESGLPFPFSILLLPLIIIEKFLGFAVNVLLAVPA
ncbi:hypothetical protein, conserved [Angomonas deanei]|uniref:Uncharacterized protein n=1 Tax=Angomonas deanei TaxID=59799 RepID=A0A7G2CNG2_9TRYP|nr:hypothetical protein, conserved [Angomonas deanei]